MNSFNVILFGEVGVGKSSVINLIAGKEVAETGPGLIGTTMSVNNYPFVINHRRVSIWDTVGLVEPELGVDAYLAPVWHAWRLIRTLESQGGVDLLLYCIHSRRVTLDTRRNYRLFYEVLCGSKIPIALVVTRCEAEEVMDHWWQRNSEVLERDGIKAAAHACVTGLRNHPKYAQSRENMDRLLEEHGAGRVVMPSDGWLKESLRAFATAPLPKGVKRKELAQVLIKRCDLDSDIAEKLADVLQSESKSGNILRDWRTEVDQTRSDHRFT